MVLDYHGGEIKEKIEYDFSVNINPHGMPKKVKDAIANNIDLLSEYPDRSCAELKKCIAKLEEISDGQILCGNGASELIMAVCAFLNSERKIHALIETPTFSGYERAVKAYGGSISYYNGIADLLEVLNGKRQCDVNQINLIYICNPNNPTGEVTGHSDLLEVLEVAKQKNITVLVDECFIDFTHEESLSGQIDNYDNLIVLKAFTKFYALAGVRLGYLLTNNKMCEGIERFLPEWNVSTLAQVAGVAAISSVQEASEWKSSTLRIVDTEREYLKQELNKLEIETSDSKANFILCRCKDNDIWNKLRKNKILVRDCSNFKGLDSSYIRICVSTHENNEKLINTIKGLI